jgi:recombination protein RecT
MKVNGSDKDEKTNKAEKAEDPAKTLKQQIANMASQFANALPNKIGVERMLRIVMTAILNNPKLAQCEPNSFFGALLQALQLGLEVNTPLGQSYLIPRWDKNAYGKGAGGLKCYFQIGYQGLLDLCYRYGKYRQITAEIVYQGDDFDYELGTRQFLRHNPKGKSTNPKYVWALYELDNGGQRFVVWTWEKVMRHAESFSESYDEETGKWKFSAWSSNQESKESMGQKTALIDLLKYAPKSVELSMAVSADERTIIAQPFSEGGETRLQFDIGNRFIEDDRGNENRVREQAPGAEKKADAEKETVPAGKPQAAKPTATATPQQAGSGAPPVKHSKADGSLFTPQEESDMDDHLQEQYEREQRGTAPNFG